MTVLIGSQIEAARLLALRHMLRLEMRGMARSKGPTAYSILRKMGFSGTREAVLKQMDELRDELLRKDAP